MSERHHLSGKLESAMIKEKLDAYKEGFHAADPWFDEPGYLEIREGGDCGGDELREIKWSDLMEKLDISSDGLYDPDRAIRLTEGWAKIFSKAAKTLERRAKVLRDKA